MEPKQKSKTPTCFGSTRQPFSGNLFTRKNYIWICFANFRLQMEPKQKSKTPAYLGSTRQPFSGNLFTRTYFANFRVQKEPNKNLKHLHVLAVQGSNFQAIFSQEGTLYGFVWQIFVCKRNQNKNLKHLHVSAGQGSHFQAIFSQEETIYGFIWQIFICKRNQNAPVSFILKSEQCANCLLSLSKRRCPSAACLPVT